MNRPIKLIFTGTILIAAALCVSFFGLRGQKPLNADWSTTQKRIANIAWALTQRQYDDYSPFKQPNRRCWPRTLQPRFLHYSKVDMVWQDEWGKPFMYCPYGDTFGHYADKPKNKKLPAKLLGRQILDRNHPDGGEWQKGEDGWEATRNGWRKDNHDGSYTHTALSIEYIELVSFGKDGEIGGNGENKDIVVRMDDYKNFKWKQKRTGGERTSSRRISWRFIEK